MKKLFSLKKWLSIHEAAAMISEGIKDSVNSADILQLALDGYLVMSINMVNGAYGRSCVPVKLEEVEFKEVPTLDGTNVLRLPVGGRIFKDRDVVYQITESIINLDSGIWDLPMIGGERIDVEYQFQVENWGPRPTSVSQDGVFVRGTDGQLFELQTYKKVHDKTSLVDYFYNPKNFHPAGGLPDDSEFVVRPENVKQFINSLADPSNVDSEFVVRPENVNQFTNNHADPSNLDRPLGTKERRTLLCIIAALCNEAKLDYRKAAKTAGLIQGVAQQMGVSLGETTIEGHLKKIPDALEARMK